MEDLRVYGNKRVYIITGNNDTMINSFINISQNYLSGQIQPYSFLDPLKDIARRNFNYNETGKNYGENKHFLRLFKYITDQYDNFSFKELMNVFEDFKKSEYDFLFIDMTQIGTSDNEELVKLQRALDAEIVLLYLKPLYDIDNKEASDICEFKNDMRYYPARVDYSIGFFLQGESDPEFKESVTKFCDFIKAHNF